MPLGNVHLVGFVSIKL